MNEKIIKQKLEEKVDRIFENTKLKKEKEMELEKEENQKELGSN